VRARSVARGQGPEDRYQGSGARDQGSEVRVKGQVSGIMVQGSGIHKILDYFPCTTETYNIRLTQP